MQLWRLGGGKRAATKLGGCEGVRHSSCRDLNFKRADALTKTVVKNVIVEQKLRFHLKLRKIKNYAEQVNGI
jgi:hypothetical protein